MIHTETSLRIICGLALVLLVAVALPSHAQNNDKEWMFADTLAEPVTMMREVLITPDGSDPVTYILNKVYQRSLENRKRLNYSASADVDVLLRDADVIPKVMPKTLMFAAQMYLRTKGLWKLFDYAMSRPSAEAQLRCYHTCHGGKVKYGKGQILRAPEDMRKKVGDQLLKLCEFELFDELYGEETLVNPKYRKKFKIRFEGSFEEDGKTVYLLTAARRRGALHEAQALHVVDGTWGILRSVYITRIFRTFRICKPIQGDIYMPWRKVDNPVEFNLEKAIEKGREMLAKEKNPTNMEKKTLRRAEELAKGERDFKPMVKVGYEIHYK